MINSNTVGTTGSNIVLSIKSFAKNSNNVGSLAET
jgi:hypothetical protein